MAHRQSQNMDYRERNENINNSSNYSNNYSENNLNNNPNNNPEMSENLTKYSPSELRLRMINELRKQEEIFSCAMELSELEQSHAMQSAGQILQHFILQNELENHDKNQAHELFLAKFQYDNSITQMMAQNEVNLMRERMQNEETLAGLRNKAKQDDLQSEKTIILCITFPFFFRQIFVRFCFHFCFLYFSSICFAHHRLNFFILFYLSCFFLQMNIRSWRPARNRCQTTSSTQQRCWRLTVSYRQTRFFTMRIC